MQNIGILQLMIFNLLLCSFLFTLPAIIIQKKGLISEDDPHQQILFPSTSNRLLDHINFINSEDDSAVVSVDIKKINQSKINFW